jgi:hypothetical protein
MWIIVSLVLISKIVYSHVRLFKQPKMNKRIIEQTNSEC